MLKLNEIKIGDIVVTNNASQYCVLSYIFDINIEHPHFIKMQNIDTGVIIEYYYSDEGKIHNDAKSVLDIKWVRKKIVMHTTGEQFGEF